MDVWNTFDERIVETIVSKSPNKLAVENPTVSEMVRLKVQNNNANTNQFNMSQMNQSKFEATSQANQSKVEPNS